VAEEEGPDAGAPSASESHDDEGLGHRRPGPTALWTKIVLFAAGLVVGVLVVGLLDVTTPDFVSASRAGSGGTVEPGPGQDRTVPPGAEVRVNAACLGVLNEAQDVYAVLGDLGRAVDEVDLMALDDVVRRLQPVEPRLARDLADCRVGAAVGGDPSTAPTAPLTTPPPVVPSTPGPTR
jgi:hypothetical protein